MKKTIDFIHEYIDDNAVSVNWDQTAGTMFSLVLAGSFEYTLVKILGEEALFLKPAESISVSKMQKWADFIRDKSGFETVLVLDEASPYMIKKLLKDKTAFVISGTQISLPFLAARIKKERVHATKDFSSFAPGTQLVFLYLLYSDDDVFFQENVSVALGISSMTAARAMNDLVSLGLLSFHIAGETGRKKVYHRISKKEFYRIGKKYLADPVKEVLYTDVVPDDPCIVKSDLTALSEQTMIAEPDRKRFAVYDRKKKIFSDHMIQKDRAIFENLPMIQVMKYDVSKLAQDGFIDPVSLILSLTENDERIELAVEELMKDRSWYEA